MLKRGWESSDTWALCSHECCARCLNIYEYHFQKTGIWKHNHVRHHVLIGQREAFVVPRKLCDAQTLCLLWKATYRVGNSHKYQAKSPASYTNPRPKYLDVVQKLGSRYHKNSQSLSKCSKVCKGDQVLRNCATERGLSKKKTKVESENTKLWYPFKLGKPLFEKWSVHSGNWALPNK